MTTKTITLISTTIALATFSLGLASTAQATLYTYDVVNPTGNHSAGKITSIKTTFNTNTQMFSWNHIINDRNNNQKSDAFWLVVSDGPEPKTHAGQYAILYGDADAKKVTAYEYSGQNNANSYKTPGNYLGSWDLNVTRNEAKNQSTFSLNIDATTLNSTYTGQCSDISNNCDAKGNQWNASMWEGIAFGEKIGYWFHPVLDGKFEYNNEGEILKFTSARRGAYDKGNLKTTVSSVSEPTTLALLGLALGLGIAGRRKLK